MGIAIKDYLYQNIINVYNFIFLFLIFIFIMILIFLIFSIIYYKEKIRNIELKIFNYFLKYFNKIAKKKNRSSDLLTVQIIIFIILSYIIGSVFDTYYSGWDGPRNNDSLYRFSIKAVDHRSHMIITKKFNIIIEPDPEIDNLGKIIKNLKKVNITAKMPLYSNSFFKVFLKKQENVLDIFHYKYYGVKMYFVNCIDIVEEKNSNVNFCEKNVWDNEDILKYKALEKKASSKDSKPLKNTLENESSSKDSNVLKKLSKLFDNFLKKSFSKDLKALNESFSKDSNVLKNESSSEDLKALNKLENLSKLFDNFLNKSSSEDSSDDDSSEDSNVFKNLSKLFDNFLNESSSEDLKALNQLEKKSSSEDSSADDSSEDSNVLKNLSKLFNNFLKKSSSEKLKALNESFSKDSKALKKTLSSSKDSNVFKNLSKLSKLFNNFLKKSFWKDLKALNKSFWKDSNVLKNESSSEKSKICFIKTKGKSIVEQGYKKIDLENDSSSKDSNVLKNLSKLFNNFLKKSSSEESKICFIKTKGKSIVETKSILEQGYKKIDLENDSSSKDSNVLKNESSSEESKGKSIVEQGYKKIDLENDSSSKDSNVLKNESSSEESKICFIKTKGKSIVETKSILEQGYKKKDLDSLEWINEIYNEIYNILVPNLLQKILDIADNSGVMEQNILKEFLDVFKELYESQNSIIKVLIKLYHLKSELNCEKSSETSETSETFLNSIKSYNKFLLKNFGLDRMLGVIENFLQKANYNSVYNFIYATWDVLSVLSHFIGAKGASDICDIIVKNTEDCFNSFDCKFNNLEQNWIELNKLLEMLKNKLVKSDLYKKLKILVSKKWNKK